MDETQKDMQWPKVDQSARYREYLRERVISIATLRGFYKTTLGALTMDQVVLAYQVAHNKLIRLGCGLTRTAATRRAGWGGLTLSSRRADLETAK